VNFVDFVTSACDLLYEWLSCVIYLQFIFKEISIEHNKQMCRFASSLLKPGRQVGSRDKAVLLNACEILVFC